MGVVKKTEKPGPVHDSTAFTHATALGQLSTYPVTATMANKAGVAYGLDAELDQKMQSKYCLQLEAEVRGNA